MAKKEKIDAKKKYLLKLRELQGKVTKEATKEATKKPTTKK